MAVTPVGLSLDRRRRTQTTWRRFRRLVGCRRRSGCDGRRFGDRRSRVAAGFGVRCAAIGFSSRRCGPDGGVTGRDVRAGRLNRRRDSDRRRLRGRRRRGRYGRARRRRNWCSCGDGGAAARPFDLRCRADSRPRCPDAASEPAAQQAKPCGAGDGAAGADAGGWRHSFAVTSALARRRSAAAASGGVFGVAGYRLGRCRAAFVRRICGRWRLHRRARRHDGVGGSRL